MPKINIEELTLVTRSVEDRNVITANLDGHKITFARQINGWRLELWVMIDDRVVHQEDNLAVAQSVWSQLVIMHHERMEELEAASANIRRELCAKLFKA